MTDRRQAARRADPLGCPGQDRRVEIEQRQAERRDVASPKRGLLIQAKRRMAPALWEDLVQSMRSEGQELTDQDIDGMAKAMAGDELTTEDLGL
ncbi:MAG: hypothetical protein V3S82_10255 [Dehalococcoidia bacterium]